jgi:hypothetical protein
MTKLLEMAIEAVSQRSPEEPDEIARAIFDMLDTVEEPYGLQDEEKAAIERSREAARRGEFAAEAQVKAVLSNRL